MPMERVTHAFKIKKTQYFIIIIINFFSCQILLKNFVKKYNFSFRNLHEDRNSYCSSFHIILELLINIGLKPIFFFYLQCVLFFQKIHKMLILMTVYQSFSLVLLWEKLCKLWTLNNYIKCQRRKF